VIVIGEGSVSLTPDQIESGVSSRGRTVKEASDANSKLMAAMTSALLESGIDQKDVQTSRFSLSKDLRTHRWQSPCDDCLSICADPVLVTMIAIVTMSR
jgi:uncharacterized protein YggE